MLFNVEESVLIGWKGNVIVLDMSICKVYALW
jgi:hypothetical protein